MAPYVDYFVLVESTTKFTGEKKPMYFDINNYEEYKDQIIHLVYDNPEVSNVTWHNEGAQRAFITQVLNFTNEEDIIIISDVDEIIDPLAI